MSSGTTVRGRLVLCPKCRRILEEIPDIPVYKCGGCLTTLQAKSRRQRISSLLAEETNNLDRVSEDETSSSLSHVTTLHRADQNSRMDQTEAGNVNSIDDPRDEVIVTEKDGNVNHQNGYEDSFGQSNHIERSGINGNEAEACDDEQVICTNLSNEDHHSDAHLHDSFTSKEDCSSKEAAFLDNGELLHLTTVKSNSRVVDSVDSSSFATKEKKEAETDSIGSTYKRSNNGELDGTTERCSFITASSPAGESLSSDVFVSSPDEQSEKPSHHGLHRLRSTDTFYSSSNEQLEQPQEISLRGLDRLRSTDTFYISSNEQLEQPGPEDISHYGRVTDAFVHPSSKHSSTLIDLSKSPTTLSSRAYYDDGVSSYEGTGVQLNNRHKHGSKHAYRPANHASSDVRYRRGRVPVCSNLGTQQHFKSSPAVVPERTQYPFRYSNLDRDELLESTGRNWINLEREKYLPDRYFYERESLATSNQIPNELYYTSNFSSPNRADQEKLKLLRMVAELQDQLNEASLNNKATSRVNWKDHKVPMYYDHEESFYNSIHPRYSGRSRDGCSWPQQRKYLQLPFSAEASSSRHQADHSLCSCPQEPKWSAQLPPSGLRYNKRLCKAHSRLNLYNSYGSCPSSPLRYVDPQLSMYSRGAKSDDQKYRYDGARKYSRDKHQLPKRHLRPLAGGAPFITCPYCLKDLQLPSDFLQFKRRRCHQLKCGACSEIVKFSLVNSTHLIPYMLEAEAPPPSEVDEGGDTVHRRNFTSTSHVTDCPSVSCSDDCGQSFCKSCSQGNGFERKRSNGLLEHEERRKGSYLNETRSKGKTPVEYESVGPSTSTSQSKIISSEIEELPEEAERVGGSSPLHRLMGYSSAREVIYS